MKQFTFFFPRRPWIAALPVSPEVAPRIVIAFCVDPCVKKYSNRFPKNCNATSLKANVGPWNNSRTQNSESFLQGVTSIRKMKG